MALNHRVTALLISREILDSAGARDTELTYAHAQY